MCVFYIIFLISLAISAPYAIEYNFDSALSDLETNTIGALAPIITPADFAFAIYVNDLPIPLPTSILGTNKISISPDTSL